MLVGLSNGFISSSSSEAFLGEVTWVLAPLNVPLPTLICLVRRVVLERSFSKVSLGCAWSP